MFEKFSRSWSLVKASASVLRSDKELLLFPLVSAICTAIVAATFIVPAIGLRIFDGSEPGPGAVLFGFAFYLCQYFVIFFFNTALVGAAMIRLEGGDPTVADGLRIARGKLVIGLLGTAWTLATFMVVPILVTRDLGPIDAVKESAALLKRTWGENLVGNAGIGLTFGLLTLLVALVLVALVIGAAITLGAVAATVVAVFGALALAFLAVFQAALSGVYSAALYRYATDGTPPDGFGDGELQAAFRAK